MEAKKTFKVFHFKNAVAWQTAKRGTMTNIGHREVEIGSPPEFKGTEDVWCPEELLIGAVSSCLMLTFLNFAGRRRLGISAYESSAEATVENADGKYRVTCIQVRPMVSLGREN
ncbi:MAG: OsmC family peroxiredoxin, partial [Acidobacteria bacterium]